MELLPHQKKYAKGYPDKGFLVHEGGTGKTICAAVWLRDGRDEDALVLCPKRVQKKWQETLNDWETRATVLSTHQGKIHPIKKWSAIVVDECDEYASPLFMKGRSAMATKLYELIKANPDTPVLLLTATPIRSSPHNLHSLLCYLGKYAAFPEWRARFCTLTFPVQLPYLVHPSWIPNDNWRTEIRKELEKHADIVLFKDIEDDLPPVEERIITTRCKPLTDTKDFIAQRRNEQTTKASAVLELGKEFRKVLVVAYFTEQIEQLEKALKRDRQTFVVQGSTKNQESILKEANETDECYLIVQASLGAGFDADSFSCVVFVSLSNSVRDHVQMKYRVRRIHNLHKVLYAYMLGGPCDTKVYENIKSGRDFVPSEWDYDKLT